MPFLSSRGDVAHGVGDGACSINNAPVAHGFALGWWNDDAVCFCDGDNGWRVSLYHVQTKQVEALPQGVAGNHGYCSGQDSAAWWLGSNNPLDENRGLWSTFGFRDKDAWILGLGPDGAMTFKPQYQSTGPTCVREPDGRVWELTTGSPDTSATTSSVCMLGESRVLFAENGAVKVRNLPAPAMPPGAIWMPHAAFVFGEWWLSYFHAVAGIVLQPFVQPFGYSVLPKGEGWHTLRALDETTLRVAVASSIGEQPGAMWVRDYNVVAGLVRDPWSADPSWAPAPRVELARVNDVPPPVSRAAFSLDRTAAYVGEPVTATITQENVTTWRWLLNDAIHRDDAGQTDGNTHVYRLTAPGVYSFGLRTSPPVEVPARNAPRTVWAMRSGCVTTAG